jgi:hypothetical protein
LNVAVLGVGWVCLCRAPIPAWAWLVTSERVRGQEGAPNEGRKDCCLPAPSQDCPVWDSHSCSIWRQVKLDLRRKLTKGLLYEDLC